MPYTKKGKRVKRATGKESQSRKVSRSDIGRVRGKDGKIHIDITNMSAYKKYQRKVKAQEKKRDAEDKAKKITSSSRATKKRMKKK